MNSLSTQAELAREELLNRTLSVAESQAKALGRPDGGMCTRTVQQMPSEHGNAYVQQVVAQSLVQRQPQPNPTVQGQQPAPKKTWLQPVPTVSNQIRVPPAPAFQQLLATLSGHPYVGSLPLPTKDELAAVQEANRYFESSPLEPWERSQGEHLQNRNKFTAMFEQKAYRLTLYILEQSEEQAGYESFRYVGAGGGDNLDASQLREAANHLAEVQSELLDMANDGIMMEVTRGEERAYREKLDDYLEQPAIVNPGFGVPDPPTSESEAHFLWAKESFPQVSQRYKALREIYGQRFPVLLGKNQDYSKITNASPDELQKYVYSQSQAVLRNIQRVRGELSPPKIWSLPPVIQQTKKLLGVEDGTGANDAIQGKLDDKAWDELTRNLALAAIQIGLTVVAAALSGGTSLVVQGARVAAAAGTAAVSLHQAGEHLADYEFKKTMSSQISLDPAMRLANEDPSFGWLALDIVFMVLDVGQAVSAFRNLTKAIRGLGALGDAAKAAKAVAAGDEAVALAQGLSKLEEVEEVVRAQARMLQQDAKLAAGFTEELFVQRVMSGLRRQVATQGAIGEQQAGLVAKVFERSHPNYRRLVNNDPEALFALLIEHGDWKSLVTALERGGEGQIAKNLLQQRQAAIQDVAAQLKALSKDKDALQINPMKGGSDELVSDVDLQIAGSDASAMLIEAESYMARRFGSNWSQMFRLNFYTEGARLTRYQEVLGVVKSNVQLSMSGNITRHAELLSFARMLQHSVDDPQAFARIKQLAKRVGVDLKELEALATMDDATRTALRNERLLKVDQLEAEYKTATGARKAELAQEISSTQMEANFLTHEANIGPGSLRLSGIGALKQDEAYQAALTQMEMIEHIIAEAGGDVVRAAREYELHKYIGRFGDVVEQANAQTKRLKAVTNHAKTVSGAQRELMEETSHQFLDPAKVRRPGVTDLPQHGGAAAPVTDEFIRNNFDMFMQEADKVLPKLKSGGLHGPMTPPRASGFPLSHEAAVTARSGGQAAANASEAMPFDIRLELSFVDAWEESHVIKLLADGRIMRCSAKCIELADQVRSSSARVRRWLDPSSATRAEASVLTDRAKDLRQRAKGIAEGSDAEAKLLAEGAEIAKEMAVVEKKALEEVQTLAHDTITRLKNPPAGGSIREAMQIEPSLKSRIPGQAEQLDTEWRNAKQVSDQLLEDERRSEIGDEFARLGRKAEQLKQDVLKVLRRELVPLPTPREQEQIDAYLRHLNTWRNAQASGAEQVEIRAVEAAAAMDTIEALAVARQGPDPELGRLWEHLESLTAIREGRLSSPRQIARPGVVGAQRGAEAVMDFVEGFGRKFSTESTRYGPFRGMTYAEVEKAIGRPPNVIEGTPPGRVRLSWRFSDDSFIHVDVPGTSNTSPYLINREPHVARTASVPNEHLHLSDEGIGVPTNSTPAHTTITPDELLKRRVQGDKSLK